MEEEAIVEMVKMYINALKPLLESMCKVSIDFEVEDLKVDVIDRQVNIKSAHYSWTPTTASK